MSTNQWITDRLPTEEDCAFQELVYDCKGVIVHYDCIAQGEAWKPIPKCEPYVKPKRYTAEWVDRGVSWPCWMIRRADFPFHTFLHSLCDQEKHREAAKRIAAIYEEVMP